MPCMRINVSTRQSAIREVSRRAYHSIHNQITAKKVFEILKDLVYNKDCKRVAETA